MNRLRALKAILTTGSFTAAGQLLGYSQSAISQMINSLESNVGFPLLYRTHGQVSLTPDGQKLLPLVEQLCNDWTTFQDRAAEIKGLQSSTIKIGTISSISAHWLPPLINNFQKSIPGSTSPSCREITLPSPNGLTIIPLISGLLTPQPSQPFL